MCSDLMLTGPLDLSLVGEIKKFIILNIYTLYERHRNEDEFLNWLSYVISFNQENASTCFFNVGDII